jgi:heme exporter protein CcmD
MKEFLAMGGYGWYVWMSYGAAAAAIAVEVVMLQTRRRRALQRARMSVDPGPVSVAGVSAGSNG